MPGRWLDMMEQCSASKAIVGVGVLLAESSVGSFRSPRPKLSRRASAIDSLFLLKHVTELFEKEQHHKCFAVVQSYFDFCQ